MSTIFDFYQRAYAINQSYGGVLMATSSITMGDRISYDGLAKNISLTYATWKPPVVEANYNLYNAGYASSLEYYTYKFALYELDQQAAYLSETSPGFPVPRVNQLSQNDWSGTCYPSALGDIRDHQRWNNLRDGAWVEAGLDSNGTPKNTINIYRADPAGGNPLFINSIDVGVGFGGAGSGPFSTLSCRVFTSPGFNTDNVGSAGGGGHPIITFFGWDGSNTYFELFKWDVGSGPYGTLISIWQYSLSSINGGYLEFPYSGKHDIFYLSQWTGDQTYTSSRNYLLIVGGGASSGGIYQLDVTNGVWSTLPGDIANYSDRFDVILIGDNKTDTFTTYMSNINSTAVDTENIGSDVKAFDSDYNWQISMDHFFVGDDQQAINGTIRGWLIYFDTGGYFSTAYYPTPTYFNYGLYSNSAYYAGGPYTLKRVVAVDFGQMVVGSGPSLSTQDLLIINCINDINYGANSFYKSQDGGFFTSATVNEDFIAMNHLICEDWTGFFHYSGSYQTGRELGLPCGAGNQHILNVKYNMDVIASSKNYLVDYDHFSYGSYSGHFTYIIYLGLAPWASSIDPHTGLAYFYIAVAGGTSADFQVPASPFGNPPNFPSAPTGVLQMLIFYA